jgi:hypothetical protein
MMTRIKIVKNGICVDREKLKETIRKECTQAYQDYYDSSIGFVSAYVLNLSRLDYAIEDLEDEILKKAQHDFNQPKDLIDWNDKYPKADQRSIGLEVLDKLSWAWTYDVEELTTDDIPAILEFLDTPPGKELEAWDKWEKYWASLDYPARRKKLLGEGEKE